MSRFHASILPNVQTYGQLLPIDALQRILDRDKSMPGMTDADYHLVGERQNEAINRAWQKMLSVWRNFTEVQKNLAEEEAGNAQTRENLLLPLFQELGYGRLSAAKAEERQITLPDGTSASYPISHFRDESPIHLVGCNVSLDKKAAGVAGAARQSPHSLVQEFLNRSDKHLWGFVANGLILRILRDNASLSRQAYVEFNLQGIFEGESFSEFALLWLCAHHSRVHTDNQPPESCWLEVWSKEAHNASVAALETLRDNVTGAIQILGQGFIAANPELRQKLANGSLDRQEYFRQLLRLAYRLIFLFVVEERNLLHGPGISTQKREAYYRFWSLSRGRDLAAQMRGTKHHDLWEGIKVVMQALGGPEGCPLLGLAPMGGFLWSKAALPDIADLRLANADLLDAIRKLAFTTLGWERRPVDWRHLGAQELGSIYESLLELHTEISDNSFKLQSAQGNDRKTTGSYYTPTALIESLLETALDPVVDQALKAENPEVALLNLKICDPACGSGHFLLAAANRIARRLACLRTGDSEPSVDAARQALRDVVARCIYGMDINPMSVELCKVGLWLETHEPGKPLSFLDHHIICANSLMGTTSAAIKQAIPATAYVALGGDDQDAVKELKKQNKDQRKHLDQWQFEKFEAAAQAVIDTVKPLLLEDMPADTLEEMARREQTWRDWQKSPEWQNKKFLYDMWTAAFVLPSYFPETGRVLPDGTHVLDEDHPFGITWNTLVTFVNGGKLIDGLAEAVNQAAREYQFFHYEVMFPEVAAKDGFDAILGNPPWERIKLQEKEWFAANNYPDIAEAPNAAARRKKIAALEKSDPLIFEKWQSALRQAEAFSHYLRNSGVYPLCGLGDINLYTVFAEWMRSNLNPAGRLGCIVPSGIATDDTTKFFFQDMVKTESLVSLYDFENRKKIFPSIDSRIKFSLLTSGSGAKPLAPNAYFVFFAHATEDVRSPEKRFTLSPAEICLLNPNTRTCPIFRSQKDAELTKAVYRRVPVLLREAQGEQPEENPWGIRFGTMFHMANDSHRFRTREQLEKDGWWLFGNVFEKEGERFLPLYEAKMIHHFNHRWATYVYGQNGLETRDTTLLELVNPEFEVMPRYWVPEEEVKGQLENLSWWHNWLMGWRDICRATDERTTIFSIIPISGVGHTMPIFYSTNKSFQLPETLANLSSFVFDYCARQKIGGTHLTYGFLNQLPLLPPSVYEHGAPWSSSLTIAEWLHPRILELTYTSEDMRPFAKDMGYNGDPFPWDEERRAQIRAELDAAFFHLYLPSNPDGTLQKSANETDAEYKRLVATFPTPRHAVEYIMESFPITKKKDIEKYGEFRTKKMILSVYDKFNIESENFKK